MYEKEITVPSELAVEVVGTKIKISGPKGTVQKNFVIPREIGLEKKENKIRVFTESSGREQKAIVGTVIAHLRNAIAGVTRGFTYKLRVVYSHFPVTVKVEGNKVVIQNFLGERVPRVAGIMEGCEVKIEGADISVSGADVDKVSQTAARLELATRRTGYDKKVFQDGIYIVSKGE